MELNLWHVEEGERRKAKGKTSFQKLYLGFTFALRPLPFACSQQTSMPVATNFRLESIQFDLEVGVF
jgi:hypothetical protein